MLAVVFVGMATCVLRMAQGDEPAAMSELRPSDSLLAVVPPAMLAGMVCVLGVYVPPVVRQALEAAARVVGGS